MKRAATCAAEDTVDEGTIRERTCDMLIGELDWETYWDWLREAQSHATGDARLLLYQAIGPIEEFDSGYRSEGSLLAYLWDIATGEVRITPAYRERLAALNRKANA